MKYLHFHPLHLYAPSVGAFVQGALCEKKRKEFIITAAHPTLFMFKGYIKRLHQS